MYIAMRTRISISQLMVFGLDLVRNQQIIKGVQKNRFIDFFFCNNARWDLGENCKSDVRLEWLFRH